MRKQRSWHVFLAALLLAAAVPLHQAQAAVVQKLLASDGFRADRFGSSVSLSGDTALVAADCDDNAKGAVYVFTSTNGVWSQQQKLTADNPAAGDYFGHSGAVSGDTAVIGAVREDVSTGAVYIFTRTNGVWSQQQKLTGDDSDTGDYFGCSAAVSGDTAAVGAGFENNKNGAVYIFTRTGDGVWTKQAKLTDDEGADGKQFGWSVSLSGDTLAVGAVRDDDNGIKSGSAYIFTRMNGMWSQQQKLLAGDGNSGDAFGQSVSLSEDSVLIGAHYNDDKVETSGAGSAYVFTRMNGVWSQQQKLTASDGATYDRFGWSVSISGDTALIGAFGDDSVQGSAYVFTRTDGMWSQQQKLTASDYSPADEFGQSVSLSGDAALIGALGNDDLKGSAYIYSGSSGPSSTVNLIPIYKLLLKRN